MLANKPWDKERTALVEALVNFRHERELTQRQLADLLDKPRSYVSKYEKGERKLDFIEVLQLCEIFEISVEVLVDSYQDVLAGKSNK